MKILILCAQGGVAGSTYSISYLANGLAERGHQVWLGCVQGSKLDELTDAKIVNKVYLRFKGKWDSSTIDTLIKLIKKEGIQLVNAQSSRDRYIAPILNTFYGTKVKVVQTRRQKPKEMNAFARFFQNIFNNHFCDKVVVISEGLKKIFLERGILEKKLKVIHNGTPTHQYVVDQQFTNALKDKYGIKEEDVVIGCVARFKHQPQFVKALQHLPKTWKVLYVGLDEQIYRERFPNEPDILAVPQEVICAGLVESKHQVLQHYNLMTVNVLPSLMDGFGLTLVESMAMGVPVVATNASGIPDVVQHEQNGLLYESEDYEGFALQIKRAMEDQQLRNKMIEKGKETALIKFSIEQTLSQYESFFQELISSK